MWGLMALIALSVSLLTRVALFVHAMMFAEQPAGAMLSAIGIGLLRDVPVVMVVAAPWLFFELLLPASWCQRLRAPLFFIYLFTLLFVGVSEGIFWDEFGVRFNFIALDYLVFTTEVIGNIRESYPAGKIISLLLLTSGLLHWGLNRFVSGPSQGAAGAPGSHAKPLSLSLVLFIFLLPVPGCSSRRLSRPITLPMSWLTMVGAALYGRQGRIN